MEKKPTRLCASVHVPLSPFSILRLICSALQHTECQVAVCDDFSVTFLLREALRATGFMMLFPHKIVWGSCFWICTSRLLTRVLLLNFVTHNFVTHKLSHTHTQLCHTQLCHTQLCHIQHCHIPSLTHILVAHNFVTCHTPSDLWQLWHF